MTSEQSDYRQIMKATSIYGGVQVFTIIISILRSKFIAVLLGPFGMGIAGLLTATLNLVSGLTNFGLSTSAVKDIAAAHSTGDESRISIIVSVFRRLVWLTGILGVLVTAIFSPWLSQITFGNKDYTFAFIWISISLLLGQLGSGQTVLLRGMRQIKSMAKSTAIGSLLGLFTTVPLYYFYGIKGIVPGIIVTAFSSFVIPWYYASKLSIKPARVPKKTTIAEAKAMLRFGFMVSISSLMTLGVSYIVRVFINHTGGVEQVGLYSAGLAIVNTYVGLIFTALGTDYYPRLSALADDDQKSAQAINQQSEIALLILAPIIMVFLVFINWVVIILYSAQFIDITNMILYAILGIFFKAVSWSIATVFLAKGAGKLYFWNELLTNTNLLILNIIGYMYWGLTGLGISFLVSYVIFFIQVFVVTRIKYNFTFTRSFYKIFIFQLLLAFACFTVVKFTVHPYPYIIGSLLIVISIIHAYMELNKRIGITEFVKKKLNK